MKYLFTLFLSLVVFNAAAQLTPFEKSTDKNYSASYAEVINYYQILAKKFPKKMRLLNYGSTDSGKPLTLVVLSADGVFDPKAVKTQGKCVFLINNGIHPGEPEGIDATMMLVRDLLIKKQLPKNMVICCIALYNIDGSLNRGSFSRANQNGPRLYGFRGNARNLDLNRDFIKADSRNALAFEEIFNTWKPHVLLDNHTSDGADYQYVMTLIETQKDKQNALLSDFTTKKLTPALYTGMKKAGYEMIPYGAGETGLPDSGIVSFIESPRYSTGYAVLHNTISYMAETHMLKPFDSRVYATYSLMQQFISFITVNAAGLVKLKQQADEQVKQQTSYAMGWQLDTTKIDTITFKGYAAGYKRSDVSGLQRLCYDRGKPYTKTVKFYNTYKPTLMVDKPMAYIIPQAWGKVIDLLKLNDVKMQRLKHDTTLNLQMYYINDYKIPQRPYEGHYLHTQVKVNTVNTLVKCLEGDYVIYTDQPVNRYIVETLEPQGVDSFFAWNFFDSILGQKEYFSDYVFEDIAADLLKRDTALHKKLDDAKAADSKLAGNAEAQLYFVYRNSPYFEKTYLRYPVGRLMQPVKLDVK